MLDAAQLARQVGDVGEMIRLVHEARTMGAAIRAGDLALLRTGDQELGNELAASRPESFGVTTAVDSFHYYMEKEKLFIARHERRATPVIDSLGTALKAVLASRFTTPLDHRRYAERRFWVDAASGERSRVTSALSSMSQGVDVERDPNGSFAAFVSCNNAEVYALAHDVERMLAPLERCLTLPGGYGVAALVTEPALARHARDPRVGVMLGRLGLDLDRQ